MSCEFEKIPGTGKDSPEEYRCVKSRCEDMYQDCIEQMCCEKCGCSCDLCEDCGTAECYGGCARS